VDDDSSCSQLPASHGGARRGTASIFDLSNADSLKASTTFDSAGEALSHSYDALEIHVEPLDDEPLFLTSSHELWAREYYIRFTRRIHQLILDSLEDKEQNLFSYYLLHDVDLNGALEKDEVQDMVAAMSRSKLNSRSVVDFMRTVDANGDGVITFMELLKHWSTHSLAEAALTCRGRNFYGALNTGLPDDWEEQVEERIRRLEPKAVREGASQYKLTLRYVTEWGIINKLQDVFTFEGVEGLVPKTMQQYHDLLTSEFEGEMDLLFNLFMSVDTSGNMSLEDDEIQQLILLLDPTATGRDIDRYVDEINPEDGVLSFVSLVDWWEQAKSVPNSLVAERGVTFLLNMKARNASNAVLSYFGESDLAKQWKLLARNEPKKLRTLRENYQQTFVELRRYKLSKRLREIEEESLKA